MGKLLSKEFYTNIEDLVTKRLKNEANKLTLQKVDWEKEAENCFICLTLFFGDVNLERLKENGIDRTFDIVKSKDGKCLHKENGELSFRNCDNIKNQYWDYSNITGPCKM